MRVGGCDLSNSDVNFLQEIEKLKKKNAESKQVKMLELKRAMTNSKWVRKQRLSLWEYHVVPIGQWPVVVGTDSMRMNDYQVMINSSRYSKACL